jgi:hypothetical protein
MTIHHRIVKTKSHMSKSQEDMSNSNAREDILAWRALCNMY